MDIHALSEKFGINAERKTDGGFPVFEKNIVGRRVLIVCDETTRAFAQPVADMVGANAAKCGLLTLPSPEPVADEATVQAVAEGGEGYDYLLAVGAGTLNDLCKYAGFLTRKPSGVYATAPSMDGFTSSVNPHPRWTDSPLP